MMETCYGCFKEYAGTEPQCPFCGHNNRTDREKYPLALPNGALLGGHYKVGKVLGQGGFGITYLAQEHKTRELVAIKEFFPENMVTRNQTMTVRVTSGDKRDNFEYGKSLFLQEAKTLAVLKNNENVVSIYEYFEENGTAYFSMEYVPGIDFGQYIKEHGGRLSFDECMEIILPVMNALSAMHSKGLVHRDVTPDNIRIAEDGRVMLLDFGAARYSVGDVTKSLEVVLKHGFAPVEQYSRHGKQGPFTDVYALSATIYYALTGKRPFDSVDRMDEDLLAWPSALGANIGHIQEEALMKGLAVRAQDRYQTIEEFKAALQEDPDKWKEELYERAKTLIANKTKDSYQRAKIILSDIPDYKDAEALIRLCEKELSSHSGRGGGKKPGVIAAVIAVLLLAAGAAAFLYFRPDKREKSHTPAPAVTENRIEASCTTSGSYDQVVYCETCGEELSREKKTILPRGHRWGPWTVVRAATETEPGLELRTCQNDSTHKETREIPTLQHVHSLNLVAERAPTCEETGNIAYYICSSCGRYFSDADGKNEINLEDTTLPVLGHSWGSWTLAEPATEEKEGIEIRVCENNASHKETREIPKLNHKLVLVEKKEATCEETGNTACYVCSYCGRYFSDANGKNEVKPESVIIPALGHSWGPWTVVEPATEKKEGVEERVCKNDASHKETRSIPRLDHQLTKVERKAPTCEEAGNTAYYVCSNCGGLFRDAKASVEISLNDTVLAPLGHDWGEWKVTKEPTAEEPGIQTRVCSRDSSHQQTEELPKLDAATVARQRMIELMNRVSLGDAEAMKDLGDCYLNAQGVDQNYREALYWYLKAAEQGNKGAMAALANCYENGFGVEQNAAVAEYWRSKAGEN